MVDEGMGDVPFLISSTTAWAAWAETSLTTTLDPLDAKK